MAEDRVVNAHFDQLVEYALAVCKECQHGVLPSQIKSHVQRAHPPKRKQAKAIAEEVGSWPGLIQYAGELNVPSQVIEPIDQLPVYQDGLMCQMDPDHCRQIFRSKGVMKKHWRTAHEWSPAEKGGRPSRTEQKQIQERIQKNCRKVHCQRLMALAATTGRFGLRIALVLTQYRLALGFRIQFKGPNREARITNNNNICRLFIACVTTVRTDTSLRGVQKD
jgi:hypothetical protein